MPGWLVATEGSLTIALDIVQTDELIREGNARELIHPIQNLRKDSGFEITDRIQTVIYADGQAFKSIEEALAQYKDYVCQQTLSSNLELRPLAEAGEDAACVEWDKDTIKIKVIRK